MKYRVSKENKSLKGEITLTSSKSESNRVLLIQALCEKEFNIENLALAKDTETMIHLLKSEDDLWDVGPAGTTMRFLTAYAASNPDKTVKITGSERMLERPIKILVDALSHLGANIQYEGEEGFPPLRISGTKLKGGSIDIDGSVSSQYISAILLVSPSFENDLTINFIGHIASKPYINMTMKLMKKYGIDLLWKENSIEVKKGSYKAKDHVVEADWSAASYWYEIAAFCDEVDFKINGLLEYSMQSDSKSVELYNFLGVKSEFDEKGVRLSKKAFDITSLNIDFEDFPDIAQTLSCSMSGMNISGRYKGLESLRIKETDRIIALDKELGKLGYQVTVEGDDLLISGKKRENKQQSIETYDDHRMAMAFAPMCLCLDYVDIIDPGVVVKSYPNYWNDLKSVGFSVEELNY